MTESTSTLQSSSSESITQAQPLGLVAKYRLDHRNAVNHFLHVGVGWPMVAVAVLIVPFRPLWSLALFVSAYAIMFFGHFVFEALRLVVDHLVGAEFADEVDVLAGEAHSNTSVLR